MFLTAGVPSFASHDGNRCTAKGVVGSITMGVDRDATHNGT
ncbi:hypothetical protein ABZZ79_14965 [Streptomyces sp. NPDC006458]